MEAWFVVSLIVILMVAVIIDAKLKEKKEDKREANADTRTREMPAIFYPNPDDY